MVPQVINISIFKFYKILENYFILTWNPNNFVYIVPFKENYYQNKRKHSIDSQKNVDSEKQRKKKNLLRLSSIESNIEFLNSSPKINVAGQVD
ncbi:unnamed protein product [Brachionus calyciflorus]|uniref:Uncharacterized protein n=1 Tax=Brachionus calyciflorus TaxID=104777 RepID=A0A814GED8_9BILA|nr:unnamed protein product [Brachionus calyciflorus]